MDDLSTIGEALTVALAELVDAAHHRRRGNGHAKGRPRGATAGTVPEPR
jgi:hypothetical protein